ncbi:MAG: GmrSD restriction endonuclease domain-containing protein [Lacipirellulaceae bacterium]
MSKGNSTSIAASGPTAPVPKDPQPSVDRIDDLARRILSGDILLPKFQRGFVWERPQIIELLDSVARGYPIGSVLLWQSRRELRSENAIAEMDIALPRPDYPVNYLLDGQQRLSAICGAMHWRGADPKSRWNIVYDLRSKEFVHLDTLDDPPLHQVRVNKLADSAGFFKHVASLDTLAAPDKADLKAQADLLFNRFKDYKIATVTLGDMSVQDVAPIFERINSTGTALTIVDLMRAATWSPDFDLIDAIDAILEELGEKGFGDIDKKVVLRIISAAAGAGYSSDSIDQLRHHDSSALKDAVANTGDAFKRTVDFLATHLRVPGATVIPYSNQLTVLTDVFRRIPSPSAEQTRAIQKWFWRSSIAGYFSGWNTGMMSSDSESVKLFASGANSEIALDVAKPSADTWRLRQFRLNNAHAKILAIVLSYQQPVDLLTGATIDMATALSWGNSKEYHHFFPQKFLKGKNEPSARINSLANIVLLTSASNKQILGLAPSVYLKKVQVAAGAERDRWLRSNLISGEAFDAALEDDFDAFLKARASTIQDEVDKLTGW